MDISRIAAHPSTSQVQRIRGGPLPLVRFEARALSWSPLLCGTAVALAVVTLTHLAARPTAAEATVHVRLAMVPLAMGVSFLFDDRAEPGLRALPRGLGQRRLARLLVMAPALAAAWVAVLAWSSAAQTPIATGSPRAGFALPVVAFSIELTGLVTIAIASAAVGIRLRDHASGGLVSVPVVMASVVVLWLLPEELAVWLPYVPAPSAGETGGAPWAAWLDAHRRWSVLAVTASVAAAWWSRDPARPGLWRSSTRQMAGRRERVSPRSWRRQS